MRKWASGLAVVFVWATSGAAGRQTAGEVDWRSRRELGLDVVVEFELEDLSTDRESGGGNGYQEHGTIHDRVFAEENGVFLGARLVTRTNGTRSNPEVRFFRTPREGATEDDAPLEAFQWKQRVGFPYSDPLGATPAELRAGLERERRIEIRDPEFQACFGDPVLVRETVVNDPDARAGVRVVSRRWNAADESGIQNSSCASALLALDDRCSFNERTGTLLERRLDVSFFRPAAPQMIQRRTWTLREDAVSSMDFPDLIEQEGRKLRTAYHLARAKPREAFDILSAWAAKRYHPWMADVAAQVWLIAIRSQADLEAFLQEELQRHTPPEWSAVGISEEDALVAVWTGRLTATFAHAELDADGHRTAFLGRLARAGRDKAALDALQRLHDSGAREISSELDQWHVRFTGAQMVEAKALLRTRLLVLDKKD